MKHIVFSLSLIFSIPAHAGGGATGGATEITQLMNNTELVMQVGEAVQTTANTLATAQATMQMLRQLPSTVVSQMTGLPIDQVAKLAQAHVVMSQASGVYKDAAAVLKKAQQDSVKLNISPSELLNYKAQAAAAFGGIYKQVYDQEQAKLQNLSVWSKDVQKQAETVKSIDANVKGIQFLASQNISMQSILAKIGESIATANSNAAMEAAAAKNEEEVHSKNEKYVIQRQEEARQATNNAVQGIQGGDIMNLNVIK